VVGLLVVDGYADLDPAAGLVIKSVALIQGSLARRAADLTAAPGVRYRSGMSCGPVAVDASVHETMQPASTLPC
jgi:hypothetical protein